MLPHVIYEYCLMMVWLVVISNTIVSSIGVLVSLSRLCQKCFLSKRKRLTLNELELYHELRSSHIQKLYELKWLMSECYRPGQQVQMKSIDVKLDLLMDLGCWIMHEVIILSEPKRLTKRGHPSLHLLYQSRHSSNTVVPSSADLTCFAMEISCCYHIWNKCTINFQGPQVVFQAVL